MNLIVFDDQRRLAFLPFTHTRPMADIRCGILSMRERWEQTLNVLTSSTWTTHSPLQAVFPLQLEEDNYFVNGAVAATKELAQAIHNLKQSSSLKATDDTLLAFRVQELPVDDVLAFADTLPAVTYQGAASQLRQVWDIFSFNGEWIEKDFELLTAGKTSEPIPDGVTTLAPDRIFIAPLAQIFPGSVINATEGAVYIGEEATIMEGCLIRGAFSLGTHATLKMGAKIYGGTTIGPHCKVGGEVNNAVFFNYSNKGHDGFIGNAVIGNWCNLGADTNCSNLKNNYGTVKIWDEQLSAMVSTGLQFCGLLMGDHSKCGINTMFNTGTVVGVSCNIFGGGFPEKYLPSFTWGGATENTTYRLDKAIETAERMMARRGLSFSEAERQLWEQLYQTYP